MFLAILLLLLGLIYPIAYYVKSNNGEIRIVATTTTSLYVTGLLDKLAEEFKEEHPNVIIDFVPVGSGEALRRAANGDACMVFVHAPSLERVYVDRGVIVNGTIFAYNYFVIAGPSNDPAGIKGFSSAVEGFKRIYVAGERGQALFVSRGDLSGTHVREWILWRKAGLNPNGTKWYIEAGAGMGKTLLIANEKNAYVLTDISTFTKFKLEGRLPNLEILVAGGDELINIYSAYLVRSCDGIKAEVAKEILEFVGTDFQEIIKIFGSDEFGSPLFNPVSGNEKYLAMRWEELSNE